MRNQYYFGGSRSLAASTPLAASIPPIVQAALAGGNLVSVGCAIGADRLVIAAVPSSQQSQLRIHAAFAASGAGSWSGSAVSAIQQAARAGVAVQWLAGGNLSVPLVARLMARSVAGLRGAHAAVFFAPGVGSLKVAGVAAARGLPVFALGAIPGNPRGQAGQWVQSSFLGFTAWQWRSSQFAMFF